MRRGDLEGSWGRAARTGREILARRLRHHGPRASGSQALQEALLLNTGASGQADGTP